MAEPVRKANPAANLLTAVHWPTVGLAAGGATLCLAVLIGALATAARSRPPAVRVIPTPVVEAPPVAAVSQVVEPIAIPVVVPAPPEPSAQVVVEQDETPTVAEKPPAVFKHIRNRSMDDLCRELLGVPEVTLQSLNAEALAALRRRQRNQPHSRPANLLASRAEFTGLPFRMGHDCQLGAESATALDKFSARIRPCLTSPGDPFNPTAAGKLIQEFNARSDVWLTSEAVPALEQMLQVQDRPVRKLLVNVLSRIEGPVATAALARRALFDLASDVREEAVRALAPRPRAEARPTLLQGLRYPWVPAAEHAAEALVFLDDRAAVPDIEHTPSEPDPEKPARRELIRINHLGNCLLCHAQSPQDNEPVRGKVPVPGRSLDAPEGGYGGGTQGIFVRADVTYLKQDFSVLQPVDNHGAWPVHQRFDYLVRQRPLTKEEAIVGTRTPTAREAVEFALRELRRGERKDEEAGN